MVGEDSLMSYCSYCDEEYPINIKSEYQENVIKGMKVRTLVDLAFCANCGEEVYIAEVNDANLQRIGQKYREENNIILISEIEELLEKYNIGAKPMSLLLGWGEATLIRYLKGQIPNKEHSDKLKSIRNPYILWEIFNSNKTVLSEVASRKVEVALSTLIELSASQENIIPERGLVDYFHNTPNVFNGYTQFNLKKTINVILFFLRNYGAFYKTKMNKLLWYADMLNFKRNAHSITGLSYIHDHYGPVPTRYEYLYGSLSDVYIYLDEGSYGTQLIPLKDFDKDCFLEYELRVLEEIGEKFKGFYSETLSDYSHREHAFLETNAKELIPFNYAKSLSID